MSVCRHASRNEQDVCMSDRRLMKTDFDCAVDLLYASQSDALGAAKVCQLLCGRVSQHCRMCQMSTENM